MWDSSLRIIKLEHHITPYQRVASALLMYRQIFSQTKTKLFGKRRESHANKKIGRRFLAHTLYDKFGTGF